METCELIKKFVTVYTEIENKCLHPQFSFPGGGKVNREMETFIEQLQAEYGEISNSRIVDYCVCTAHYWKDLKRAWRPNISFGKKAIQRFIEFKNGKKYYEDKWLKENNLSRPMLESLIIDTSNHPLSKYIYLEAEEQTKIRAQKLNMFTFLCIRSTLLWSPFSQACSSCTSRDRCKEETKNLYPELYRIRLEKWQKKK